MNLKFNFWLIRSANTRARKAILFALFFIPSVLFLSAFRFGDNKSVSRFELARFIQELVLKALPDAQGSIELFEFDDLSGSESISVTTGYRIMAGFSDGSFRAEDGLRNHEVLWYLGRTWEFLRVNAPEKEETKILGKLVGFNRDRFYMNIKSSFSLFSSNSVAYEQANVKVLSELRQIFKMKSPVQKNMEISLIDCSSGRPVYPAFIAVNSSVYAVDDQGVAKVSLDKGDKEKYEILISADGYQTLLFKRDLLQMKNTQFSLKPFNGQVIIRAFSEIDKKPIKVFSVNLDESKTRTSIDGVTVIKGLERGSHQLKIESSGCAPIHKKMYSGQPITELDVFFKPS